MDGPLVKKQNEKMLRIERETREDVRILKRFLMPDDEKPAFLPEPIDSITGYNELEHNMEQEEFKNEMVNKILG